MTYYIESWWSINASTSQVFIRSDYNFLPIRHKAVTLAIVDFFIVNTLNPICGVATVYH